MPEIAVAEKNLIGEAVFVRDRQMARTPARSFQRVFYRLNTPFSLVNVD